MNLDPILTDTVGALSSIGISARLVPEDGFDSVESEFNHEETAARIYLDHPYLAELTIDGCQFCHAYQINWVVRDSRIETNWPMVNLALRTYPPTNLPDWLLRIVRRTRQRMPEWKPIDENPRRTPRFQNTYEQKIAIRLNECKFMFSDDIREVTRVWRVFLDPDEASWSIGQSAALEKIRRDFQEIYDVGQSAAETLLRIPAPTETSQVPES